MGVIMQYFPMKIFMMILVCLFLVSCATRKEITQFKDDSQTIKNRLVSLQSENKELRQRLQKIEKSIEDIEKQANINRADLLAEMEDLKRQFQFLNQMLEDNISRVSKYMDKSGTTSRRPPSNSSYPDSVKADTTTKNRGEQIDAQKLYDSSYLDISRGNYELARMGFQEFLKRFPESSLADNAQYWLAETYYAQEDYQQAISQFKTIISNYSGSDKSAAGLLKIGFSYLKLGDNANGKRYLNQVIDRFPYSEEAKVAQNRIANINQ